MTDYLQPEFYRFSRDSLLLVEEVVRLKCSGERLMDLGAGSGIIGCELSRRLEIPEVYFLELQREWEPYLTANIRSLIPEKKTEILWGSFSEWKSSSPFDLIVANPPYYLPGHGELSPDLNRRLCRCFLVDDWEILGNTARGALAPSGNAFFIAPESVLPHIRNSWKGIPFEVNHLGDRVILRISGTG